MEINESEKQTQGAGSPKVEAFRWVQRKGSSTTHAQMQSLEFEKVSLVFPEPNPRRRANVRRSRPNVAILVCSCRFFCLVSATLGCSCCLWERFQDTWMSLGAESAGLAQQIFGARMRHTGGSMLDTHVDAKCSLLTKLDGQAQSKG